MKILGKPYAPEEFDEYLKTLTWGAWKPQYIVLHHTAAPSLAQRPHGFLPQHMTYLREFYEEKGWSAGPHAFVDDDQIWTFSPLTSRGVHAVGFNRTGIGLELLGDYDTESPFEGRGLAVWKTGMAAVRSLMKRLNLGESAIKFHREDGYTSKTCPGKKIRKDWVLTV